ncbi:MAG: glycosyltransferase [Flavobacteriia bacterium]|jgi:cellulose synthase/poly-beta-1,6-N-acetylglucosamine synthase-like glycosyltransferase
MNLSLHILELTLLIWFAFTVIYTSFYAFVSLFYKAPTQANPSGKSATILVLIPAYKEDKVILKTIQAICKQSYPTENYKIVLIADHFDRQSILEIQKFPIEVLDVNFEKSTKSIAINYALKNQRRDFDLVAILDADNLVEPNFLTEINLSFQNKHRSIQGQRIAKNSNTSFAVLDAISEEINNSIYCKGQQVFGFTSRLTGSGMAFEYALFKNLMTQINAIGGFDKELELQLIQHKAPISYNPNIKIYDEKVSKSAVLMNQRSRWISAQFHYMKKYSTVGLVNLIRYGDFAFFNKYLQLFLLPKMMLALFFLAGIALNLVFANKGNLTPWLLFALTFAVSNILVFPSKYLNVNLLNLLYLVPITLLKMFLKLPKLYTANKQFIHTPHES